MKTLQQVIERHDYQRLSAQLAERTEELQKAIFEKMLELDIKSLLDLSILTDMDGMYLSVKKEEKDEEYFYPFGYTSDYSFFRNIIKMKNAQRIEFLNKAQSYIDELDRIETEKSNELSKIL